jgi:hypothetical protein
MSGYVLITAPHDEAAFVARTCESVLSQTLPPLRWLVIDDASSRRNAVHTASVPPGYHEDE